VLTNGEYIQTGPDAGQLRKFRVQAEYGNMLWVEAMNGHYKGEMLTFPGNVLRVWKVEDLGTW